MAKKLNIYKFKARNSDKIVVDIAGIASDINVATDGDKYRVLKRLDDNHIQILANFL